MSKKWREAFIIAIAVGVIAIVVWVIFIGTRFGLPGLYSFLENMMAGIAVSAFTFAIAILLIEGPVLTRERRLQKVISIATRRVAQLNEEIAITLSREIGEYLASKLDSHIDLYGDERGDWTAFKPLLRSVFQEASRVPVDGLPKSSPMSEEDYLPFVQAAQSFMKRVRNALGADWEIQAQLYELVEHWDELDTHIRKAGYSYNIADEKMRYKALAVIGGTLIDIIEACPRLLSTTD